MPLGKLTKDVGSKELKDFFKAWVEARAEKSGRALWKQDSAWKQLMEGGMKQRDLSGSISSVNEPVGLYTTPSLEYLSGLVAGSGKRTSLPQLVNRYSYQTNMGRYAAKGGPKKSLQETRHLVRLLLDKRANNLKAETPEEWIDQLKWMERSGVPKVGEDVYHSTPDAIMGTGQMYPLLKSETIAPFLRSKGYDAVTFPDIVAGGPDLIQTAILRPGVTTAQIGPNVRRLAIAGMAGMGTAAGTVNTADASPKNTLISKILGTAKDKVVEIPKKVVVPFEKGAVLQPKEGMNPFRDGVDLTSFSEDILNVYDNLYNKNRGVLISGKGKADILSGAKKFVLEHQRNSEALKEFNLTYEMLREIPGFDDGLRIMSALQYVKEKGFISVESAARDIATVLPFSPSVRKLAIAGMAGGSAMGLMDQLSPKEAEASPVGNLIKDAGKLALGEESSTAGALIGRQLKAFGDRVVKSVRKAAGDKRYLVFEDNTAQQVTKAELNSVMRTIGTDKYMNKFSRASEEEKKRMAIKRLIMDTGGTLPSGNVSKGTELSTVGVKKSSVKAFREADNEASRSILSTAPDTVGVWKDGKYMTMPKPYAELLEKEGLVRIDKSQRGAIK